jgi:N4-(beta-N-acetylglucosaminyl)-L-asparaginase
MKRREVIQKGMLATGGIWLLGESSAAGEGPSGSLTSGEKSAGNLPAVFPLVISTWAPNVKANAAAWEVLAKGGRALDAVEAGVRVPEADPEDSSVGYGGLPDRDGNVTLDACIMDEKGNCGSVMFLQHIMHPISVARMVMEKTPHVILAGEGALQFALSNGFKKQNLLTSQSEKIWRNWLKENKYDPMETIRHMKKSGTEPQKGGIGNHDTIGMLAIDLNGNLSGACSTSGMAFKLHGRVGDSPVIGAGLFVDNEVGAATATGVGEEVVRICGAHTIVEAMRYGKSPEEACRIGVERLHKLRGNRVRDFQIGFLAVNKSGELGAFSLLPGFTYACRLSDGKDAVKEAPSLLK